MKNVLIIHGEKPNRDGSMHSAFLTRLKRAVEICNFTKIDLVVLTGGKTRKNAVSEAKAGKQYLEDKINAKIILENNARTTSENIRFTKKLLNKISMQELIVISGDHRMRRIKYLYKKPLERSTRQS